MTFELIQSVSSETSVRTVLRVQQDPESRELRRDRVSSRGRYRVGVFFGIRLECCRLPVSVQQRTVRSVARRRKYGNCALRAIADINHHRETLSDAVTYRLRLGRCFRVPWPANDRDMSSQVAPRGSHVGWANAER